MRASPEEFKALTDKLRKGWLMCLLKDTVDHLKKLSSPFHYLKQLTLKLMKSKMFLNKNITQVPLQVYLMMIKSIFDQCSKNQWTNVTMTSLLPTDSIM